MCIRDSYEGEQLGQGRENAKQFLADNAEIMVEISERIRTESGVGVVDEDESTGADLDLDVMSAADDLPISLTVD